MIQVPAGAMMPVTGEVFHSALIITLIGEYTLSDIVSAVASATASPRFRPGLGLLMDARRSTTTPTSAEIKIWARRVAILRKKGLSARCALLLRPEVYRFGPARMTVLYLKKREIDIALFSNMEKALLWLANGADSSTNLTIQ